MKTLLKIDGDSHIGKDQIERMATSVIENADPVLAVGIAKMLAAAAKKIEDAAKDQCLEAIQAAGAKSVEVGDAMFTYTNGRKSYDFSDVPEWMDIANQIECLNEQRKEVEKQLKADGKGTMKIGADYVRVTWR